MEPRTDLSRSLFVETVVFGRKRKDIAVEFGKLVLPSLGDARLNGWSWPHQENLEPNPR